MTPADAESRPLPSVLDRLSARPCLVRDAILRDLGWLLNARALPDAMTCRHPRVAQSVLNYGLRDLADDALLGTTGDRLQERVRRAIERFEPRLDPRTLKVTVHSHSQGPLLLGVIEVEIAAEIRVLPMHQALRIRTRIDVETGECLLEDCPDE